MDKMKEFLLNKMSQWGKEMDGDIMLFSGPCSSPLTKWFVVEELLKEFNKMEKVYD